MAMTAAHTSERALAVLYGDGAGCSCSRTLCRSVQACARALARARWHSCLAGAVVGVSLFSHSVPEAFGAFDLAFMTLFYVTGGDPWPDALPKNNEDGCVWNEEVYLCEN